MDGLSPWFTFAYYFPVANSHRAEVNAAPREIILRLYQLFDTPRCKVQDKTRPTSPSRQNENENFVKMHIYRSRS